MFRYRLVRAIMNVLRAIVLARLHVTGRENIPTSGPYLVVVNHMSSADSPILLIAFPPLPWRFFAGEKWKNHWLWGRLMGWLGAVYINRGEVDRPALRQALDALAGGAVFALAPEGTRSKVGYMQAAKDGAAFLALRANVPILPVGLSNTDHLFANFRRLRRTDVNIRIGRLFTLPQSGGRVRGHELATYTHLIMCHIAVLVDERHRGLYQDSPALHALLAGQDPWPAAQQLTIDN
jgi:1-acyl-sn-glycerol-3-phosphate acyltransferase